MQFGAVNHANFSVFHFHTVSHIYHFCFQISQMEDMSWLPPKDIGIYPVAMALYESHMMNTYKFIFKNPLQTHHIVYQKNSTDT